MLKRALSLPRKTVFIKNQIVSESPEQAIPPIVYQTAESRWTNRHHWNAMAEHRKQNPTLSFVFYDAKKRDQYMEQEWSDHLIHSIYRRSVFGQMKADIFRYCIIYDRGGYYLDVNKGLRAPFQSFHTTNSSGVFAFENNDSGYPISDRLARRLQHPSKNVVQWAFGFSPASPILEKTIVIIVENEKWASPGIFPSAKSAIISFCGPLAFTKAVHSVLDHDPQIRMAQAGIDFGQSSVYRLPGGSQLNRFRHYSEITNQPILMPRSNPHN